MTETAWNILENKLRAMEKREQKRARCIAKGIPFGKFQVVFFVTKIIPITNTFKQMTIFYVMM